MRVFLAVLLMLCSAVAVNADIRFRRANRFMPLRNLRMFNGYNQWNPSYDSSYYTPYSSNNAHWSTTTDGTETNVPYSQSTTNGWNSTTNGWQPQPIPTNNPIRMEPTPADPSTRPTNELRNNNGIDTTTNGFNTTNRDINTTINGNNNSNRYNNSNGYNNTNRGINNTTNGYNNTNSNNVTQRTTTPRQSYPTNYQLQSTTNNYWESFGNK